MSTSSFSITSTPRGLAAVTVRVLGQLDRTGVARLRTELASGARPASASCSWICPGSATLTPARPRRWPGPASNCADAAGI